tara:strand:+ start:45 stop:677 length:633 start_codon:yes stop_codon:yes gene_type:complete
MLDNKVKVGIIDLGINNTQSIYNAYQSINCKVKIIKKKQNLTNYNIIVLPGVGSFKHGINKLNSLKIKNEIKKFLEKSPKNYLIGICLGMQLLFDQSLEFGLTKGMSFIKGKVLPLDLIKCKKVPHMNWNSILVDKKDKIFCKFTKKKFYFVHSFYCKPFKKSKVIAQTSHNNFKFCSIVKDGNIIGLQFHPEKSGNEGIKVLKRINNLI